MRCGGSLLDTYLDGSYNAELDMGNSDGQELHRLDAARQRQIQQQRLQNALTSGTSRSLGDRAHGHRSLSSSSCLPWPREEAGQAGEAKLTGRRKERVSSSIRRLTRLMQLSQQLQPNYKRILLGLPRCPSEQPAKQSAGSHGPSLARRGKKNKADDKLDEGQS